MSGLDRATLIALLPDWTLTLTLIFGGCCSNAYFLEQATRIQPACGTLMTFLQFIFTTLQMLPTQLSFYEDEQDSGDKIHKDIGVGRRMWLPRFVAPKVPLTRWSIQVALYFGTTILNNTAFSFHVPVPVHIIFRSGGLVVSMLAGYCLKGRRYSALQIISVLLVTGGVITSTLATTPSDDGNVSSGSSGSVSAATYFAGITLLTLALFLSALMGLYQEQTFAQYGAKHWQESLFYNHFLSLPLFALRWRTLTKEWDMAQADKRMWVGWGPPRMPARAASIKHGFFGSSRSISLAQDSLLSPGAVWDVRAPLLGAAASMMTSALPTSLTKGPSVGLLIPILFPALALNVITQIFCVNGVNRLTAMCSSLTVTLVLVIRKALSLAISVLIIAPAMGEEVQGIFLLTVGATFVLIGTLGYAVGTAQAQSKGKSNETDNARQQQRTKNGDRIKEPSPSLQGSDRAKSTALAANSNERSRKRS